MVKKLSAICAGICLAGLLWSPPSLGQSEEETQDLQKEIEALKSGQQAIRKDLSEIKKLLSSMQQQPKKEGPVNIVFDIEDAPYKGDANAKLTLVEFSDYQ